jgi:hypothetical protein
MLCASNLQNCRLIFEIYYTVNNTESVVLLCKSFGVLAQYINTISGTAKLTPNLPESEA